MSFRPVLTGRERRAGAALIAGNALAALTFVSWLVVGRHVAHAGSLGAQVAVLTGFVLLVLLEVLRVAQVSTLWLCALRAKDPVPVRAQPGLRVAVLTTIVPGKEPLDVVLRTLRAMRRLRYDGPVDVWILDEGDSPAVRAAARALGVHHFTRKHRPEYNTESGAFRARTKSGNHNAWRAEFEYRYDVVAQMDPDHVPSPDFLERTLGYFSDPDVAFVVAPQVYGNASDGFVPFAAAQQSYVFHGIIQRGGNGLEAPLLIGTNHLYRPVAWGQIGGYQDSIIEDHLTAMHVFAARNPETGKRWRGVYTPDILAVGEGPSSWTDFFAQQKRWAYGIWQILLRHSPSVLPRLDGRQRLAFALLQLFYPSVALLWLGGNLLTTIYLLLGVSAAHASLVTWGALWSLSVASSISVFLWLRRFNLVEHERREWGGKGMLMMLFTVPVYVGAAFAAVAGRPLAYRVTAKGALATHDSWRTFRPHLRAGAAALGLLGTGLALGHAAIGEVLWMALTAVLALAPVAVFAASRRRTAPGVLRLRPAPVDLVDLVAAEATQPAVAAHIDLAAYEAEPATQPAVA